jgi:hypothetical protein
MALVNASTRFTGLDATPNNLAFGFTPTIGNGLIVVGIYGGDSAVMSDNGGGNTWEIVEGTVLFGTLFVAATRLTSVPSTVSLNPAGAFDFGDAFVLEINGLQAAGTLIQDSDSLTTDGSEAATSSGVASVTLSQAAGFILAVGAAASATSNDAFDIISGYTTIDEFLGHKTVSSVGPHTGEVTFEQTPGDAMILLAAIANEAGPPPPPAADWNWRRRQNRPAPFKPGRAR